MAQEPPPFWVLGMTLNLCMRELDLYFSALTYLPPLTCVPCSPLEEPSHHVTGLRHYHQMFRIFM